MKERDGQVKMSGVDTVTNEAAVSVDPAKLRAWADDAERERIPSTAALLRAAAAEIDELREAVAESSSVSAVQAAYELLQKELSETKTRLESAEANLRECHEAAVDHFARFGGDPK